MAARLSSAALIAASLSACAANYVVRPPQVAASAAKAPVAVLDHGRHSSIVIGQPDGRMIRYAYGQWAWYAQGDTRMGQGFTAMFAESPAALGRRVLPGPLTRELLGQQVRVGFEHALLLEVDAEAARRLTARLEAIVAAGRDRTLVNHDVDLDFFPHPVPYSRAHSSNRVVAGWLREMGAVVDGDGLMADWQLRR